MGGGAAVGALVERGMGGGEPSGVLPSAMLPFPSTTICSSLPAPQPPARTGSGGWGGGVAFSCRAGARHAAQPLLPAVRSAQRSPSWHLCANRSTAPPGTCAHAPSRCSRYVCVCRSCGGVGEEEPARLARFGMERAVRRGGVRPHWGPMLEVTMRQSSRGAPGMHEHASQSVSAGQA